MPTESSPLVNHPPAPELLRPLLQKTSRTFALTIPLLPEPLQTDVAVAYLLFRIIDTFEDATHWTPERRTTALASFVELLDGSGDLTAARQATALWVTDPPLDHAGYLELLSATPDVIRWYQDRQPAARDQLRRHVTRSAREMIDIVRRTRADGVLQLETVDDLRRYCFSVAGLVGQMLTELFVLQSPSCEKVAGDLRACAVEFGEALQLVNILKDAGADAAEGRVYLPPMVPRAEVFQMARADLRRAIEYTNLLRSAGADSGTVAFNTLNARLAISTLLLLREKGPGAKLTRLQVTGIASEVLSAVDHGTELFPESP
jgi:farnesyl-diphosphate farnesyltransferase